MTEENKNNEMQENPTDELTVPVADNLSSELTEEEDNGDFKWYAVRIISGHENKVKAYLDNEIRNEKLEDKIRNVLIPLEKIFEVKGGKKKVKLKNFLPGYILIEADLDDKIRDFVSKTPSIINMVGSKSVKGKRLDPIALKPMEVKRIKSILNEEGDEKKLDIQLNIGDPVKVTSGPFNNFSGNILEVNLEKLKVKVMVSIFGRKTPIELELTQVEKEK
jgi:transcriptional antiterminator NusG